MFRSTPFDKLLDKATSNILMEPDWRSILEINDLIRQNDVQPKQALASIKKKLVAPNPHTAYYALLVLESVVKNCGTAVHEELNSKVFVDSLHELAKTTQHENVRQKLLELIQTWTFAFRKNPKYTYLKEIMQQMKQEGTKFPALRESDAMFSTDTAPEWADGEVCHRCRVPFTLVQRKHHCRACGQVFCSQCSQKTTSLPKFGIEKEVRVCDACYDQVTKPASASAASNSVTAKETKEPQNPPGKSEEELREEEELQLALALSQSEAEAKAKEKMRVTSVYHNAVKQEPRQIEPSSSPPEEQNVPPELARYLNRSLWENKQPGNTPSTNQIRVASPTAPAPAPNNRENGVPDIEIDEFVKTLKTQVEIFVNRMKSNSSRGRSIANDSSVQTLFMNITQMHSRLLQYIQCHDDSRLHYERLQDKLTQVKDARAALDALREEHREKLRRQAEEAERQRQLQMAHKLEIMRKKKQEYLQYQRQLALQRIQEQEREMQMRQEQQKQQYLMTGATGYGGYVGSPVHAGQQPQQQAYAPIPGQAHMQMVPYGYQYGPPIPGHVMGLPQSPGGPPPATAGIQTPQRMQGPPGQPLYSPGMQPPPGMGPPITQHRMSVGMMHQGMMPPGTPHTVQSHTRITAQPAMGQPPSQIGQQPGQMGQQPGQIVQQPGQIGQQPGQMGPQQMPMGQQQPGAPPQSPQVPQQQQNGDNQTGELISFD